MGVERRAERSATLDTYWESISGACFKFKKKKKSILENNYRRREHLNQRILLKKSSKIKEFAQGIHENQLDCSWKPSKSRSLRRESIKIRTLLRESTKLKEFAQGIH